MGPMIHMTLIPIIISMLTTLGLFLRSLFLKSRRREPGAPKTRGIVIHWARTYDLILWFATRGEEQNLRRRFVDLARLQPGEVALDVGCGTGTLAIEVCERVGATGRVVGVDPSRQMIARARRKARRAGTSIDFQPGVIEHLSFPDHSFDIVLCTWVIHHVPKEIKQQGLSEIARVLKSEGRLLIVDASVNDLPLEEAGFSQIDAGEIPFRRKLSFTLERKILEGERKDLVQANDDLTVGKGAPQVEGAPQERRVSHHPHVHTQ
jgi:ubiquinone/menaquinone biosynthesis C-methylase UbiE